MDVLHVQRAEVLAERAEALRDVRLTAPRPGPLGGYLLTIAARLPESLAATPFILLHEGRETARTMPTPRGKNTFVRLEAGTIGLGESFELILAADTPDGPAPAARILCRQSPVETGRSPRHSPLMLTCWARSGSTLCMRLLLGHPEIAVHPRFPHEILAGFYWLKLFQTLSGPAAHEASLDVGGLVYEPGAAGPNPFFHADGRAGLADPDWPASGYVRELGAFCQRSIDGFYAQVAAQTNKAATRFFAEKVNPRLAEVRRAAFQLYPQTREVLLLRDPRDAFCSIAAFNEKRGKPFFMRAAVDTDEEYIHAVMGPQYDALLHALDANPEALVLRYEDLVAEPRAELSRLLDHAGLDASPDVVEAMLGGGGDEDKQAFHMTAPDAARSAGRFARDMSPRLQEVAGIRFKAFFARFGYA